MATKAELESACRRYVSSCEAVRSAAVTHDYPEALGLAAVSLSVAWDAVAYQRRYQRIESPELPTVDAILRYSPPLFDRRGLDALDIWVASAKRADKALATAIRSGIESSRRAMALAARLWDDAEALSPAPVAPGDQSAAKGIVEVWTAMGVTALRPESGAAVNRHITSPSGQVLAKCSMCGTFHQASLKEVLSPTACRDCGRASDFVIVRRFF